MLSVASERAGSLYGANLLGSGIGAVAAPAILDALGAERAVLGAGTLGAVAAFALVARGVGRPERAVANPGPAARPRSARRRTSWAPVAALAVVAVLAGSVVAGPELRPSPYRRLSQMRLDPDTQVLATRQDARSRLDIVTSPRPG
jgi:hypothetical protein